MTSYGKDLFTKNLHSSGKIFWKDFSPPLGNAGVATLSAVLEASDPEGDAGGHVITNLGSLTMSGDANIANSDGKITGAAEVQCNQLTTSFATCLDVQVGDDLSLGTSGASGGTITFNSQASAGACSITGPSLTNRVEILNADLTSSSNTFPSGINGDLAATLVLGNSAGSTSIDMNAQNITNATTITGNTIHASSTTGNSSLSLTANTGHQGGININGVSGADVDTFINGDATQKDGAVKNTECRNLNLSHSSNVLSTLSRVLALDNSAGTTNINMNGQNIQNLLELDFHDTIAGTKIKGSTKDGDPTVVTYCDLSSDTNTFPSTINGDLTATLVLGNSAGTTNINMNGQNIQNLVELDFHDTIAGTKITGSTKTGDPTLCSHLVLGESCTNNGGLLVYQPSYEITKRWDDTDYLLFESYTAHLVYNPTILQAQTFSCSFYISEGDDNDLLWAIGVQSRVRGSGAAFSPPINTSDGSGLAASILTGSAQFVNSNDTYTTGMVNVSCYVEGTTFSTTNDYKLWPMLKTNTTTNAGDYTFHCGNRSSSTPWPPLILRRQFIPENININIS
mgnify:CR=1 FL=1